MNLKEEITQYLRGKISSEYHVSIKQEYNESLKDIWLIRVYNGKIEVRTGFNISILAHCSNYECVFDAIVADIKEKIKETETLKKDNDDLIKSLEVARGRWCARVLNHECTSCTMIDHIERCMFDVLISKLKGY